MFEKEAGKWVKENTKIDYKASYGEFPIEPSATKSFKAGAEFGYNKAKEEIQEQGLALQSDMDKTIEQNIALKEQIKKMKCCENCKHKNLNWQFSPICEARNKIKIENPLTCKCDQWEIKEND